MTLMNTCFFYNPKPVRLPPLPRDALSKQWCKIMTVCAYTTDKWVLIGAMWCVWGSRKNEILRYLKYLSWQPFLQKNVDNLISKCGGKPTQRRKTTCVFPNFFESLVKIWNPASVYSDKSTLLTSRITLHKAFMRRMARKFPEWICITLRTARI